MNDGLIFGIGVLVTAMVTTSVGLLLWAALTSQDSAAQYAIRPPQRVASIASHKLRRLG